MPPHDIKDVKYLLQKTNVRIVVADKAYGANSLHKYCNENDIEAHIPMREYSKSRHNNFSARRKVSKYF